MQRLNTYATFESTQDFQLLVIISNDQVQEVPNDKFEGKDIFLGPVLRINCFEAVRFLKPVILQLPVALRERRDLNLNSTTCHVRVLYSGDEQKEWVEITDDLANPASFDGKLVTFQVERFSR